MTSPTDKEKAKIIEQWISTPEGRAKLASIMIQPLRTRRDYRVSVHGIAIPADAAFVCKKCGTWSDDKNFVHDPDECVVAEVLRS